jgi:hypothetical protein
MVNGGQEWSKMVKNVRRRSRVVNEGQDGWSRVVLVGQ